MQELETEYKPMYEAEGQMGGVVGAVITLIVGVSVATLVMTFTGSLSGQTYQLVEADLDAITNETVKAHVKNAIISGFEAQEQTGNYLPLIVLAIVIFLILSLVLGMTAFGNAGGGYRGSAL